LFPIGRGRRAGAARVRVIAGGRIALSELRHRPWACNRLRRGHQTLMEVGLCDTGVAAAAVSRAIVAAIVAAGHHP
jgi:hypothetical protein